MAIRRLLNSTITDGIKYNRSSDAVPATGGSVRYANGYFYHVFTGDGTFATRKPLTVEVLAVAGGGGGAGSSFPNGGGGGGAGGLVEYTSRVMSDGASATITIGGGGNAGTSGSTPGANGNNTTLLKQAAQI